VDAYELLYHRVCPVTWKGWNGDTAYLGGNAWNSGSSQYVDHMNTAEFQTNYRCIGYNEYPVAGKVQFAPSGMGFLLTGNYLPDARTYYCPSAAGMLSGYAAPSNEGLTVYNSGAYFGVNLSQWKTAGGYDAQTFVYGKWSFLVSNVAWLCLATTTIEMSCIISMTRGARPRTVAEIRSPRVSPAQSRRSLPETWRTIFRPRKYLPDARS